jgi:hypothetical protein
VYMKVQFNGGCGHWQIGDREGLLQLIAMAAPEVEVQLLDIEVLWFKDIEFKINGYRNLQAPQIEGSKRPGKSTLFLHR